MGQCRYHGGATKNGAKAAAKKIAASMGAPLDISPHDALLLCVQVMAGEVGYCTHRIEQLTDETYVGNPVTITEEATDLGDTTITKESTRTGPPELNIWIVARRDAMDKLARYSKMALDAGIEERRVRLAENMALMLAPVMEAIFTELKLTDKQKQAAPAILERNLMTLEGEAYEVIEGNGNGQGEH